MILIMKTQVGAVGIIITTGIAISSSDSSSNREQATGEQARQPVFGQAMNRLFAQQATEEQTTGEHEKDKCQEGHRFEQSLKRTRLLFHG